MENTLSLRPELLNGPQHSMRAKGSSPATSGDVKILKSYRSDPTDLQVHPLWLHYTWCGSNSCSVLSFLEVREESSEHLPGCAALISCLAPPHFQTRPLDSLIPASSLLIASWLFLGGSCLGASFLSAGPLLSLAILLCPPLLILQQQVALPNPGPFLSTLRTNRSLGYCLIEFPLGLCSICLESVSPCPAEHVIFPTSFDLPIWFFTARLGVTEPCSFAGPPDLLREAG